MKSLATNEKGATAIEYALIATLVSIVIVTGVTSMGSKLNVFFTQVATNLH